MAAHHPQFISESYPGVVEVDLGTGYAFLLDSFAFLTAIISEELPSPFPMHAPCCILDMHDLCDRFWLNLGSDHAAGAERRHQLCWLIDNAVPFTIKAVIDEGGRRPFKGDVTTAFAYYVKIEDKARAALFKLFTQ